MKKLFLLLCLLSIFMTGCFGKSSEDKCAKDLESKDVSVRLNAARELGDIATSEAIRLLILHKGDPDFRVKEEIKKSIKKIDKRTFLN